MEAHQLARNGVAHVTDLFDGGGFVHSQIRSTRIQTRRQSHSGPSLGASQFLAMPVARASRPFAPDQKLTGGTPVPLALAARAPSVSPHAKVCGCNKARPFNTSAYKTLECPGPLLSYIRA